MTVHLLQEQFHHLRMVETANELPKLLRNAEKMSWTYQEFIKKFFITGLSKEKKKVLKKE